MLYQSKKHNPDDFLICSQGTNANLIFHATFTTTAFSVILNIIYDMFRFYNFTQFRFANQLILGIELICAGRQNDIGKSLCNNNNADKLRSMKSFPERNIRFRLLFR